MNLIVDKRKVLLTSIKDSLEAIDEDERAIYFYDDNDVNLCTIFFHELSDLSEVGDKATYLFKSLDSSAIIRGTVETEGVVKTFKIHGIIPLSLLSDYNFITGTVGGFSSSADMKFNKTSWSVGMNITISNLYLVMR